MFRNRNRGTGTKSRPHPLFIRFFAGRIYRGGFSFIWARAARSEIQFVDLHTRRNKIYQAFMRERKRQREEVCSFRLLLLLS